MRAEEILRLVDNYGAWSSTQTYEPLRDAIAEQAAERRQLAKHCVVVISKPIHFGDWQPEVWCTVCQVRMEISRNEEKQKLVHRDDCLVAKVELEG